MSTVSVTRCADDLVVKSMRRLASCRESPSSVKRGKSSHPWCRVNQPKMPVRRSAISAVNAKAPGAMSGSRPSWLGAAWCRLCLPLHQLWLSPMMAPDSTSAVHSFHLALTKICR